MNVRNQESANTDRTVKVMSLIEDDDLSSGSDANSEVKLKLYQCLESGRDVEAEILLQLPSQSVHYLLKVQRFSVSLKRPDVMSKNLVHHHLPIRS